MGAGQEPRQPARAGRDHLLQPAGRRAPLLRRHLRARGRRLVHAPPLVLPGVHHRVRLRRRRPGGARRRAVLGEPAGARIGPDAPDLPPRLPLGQLHGGAHRHDQRAQRVGRRAARGGRAERHLVQQPQDLRRPEGQVRARADRVPHDTRGDVRRGADGLLRGVVGLLPRARLRVRVPGAAVRHRDHRQRVRVEDRAQRAAGELARGLLGHVQEARRRATPLGRPHRVPRPLLADALAVGVVGPIQLAARGIGRLRLDQRGVPGRRRLRRRVPHLRRRRRVHAHLGRHDHRLRWL